MGLRSFIPFVGGTKPGALESGESDDPADQLTAIEVDAEKAEELHERAAECSPVVSIKPFKHEGGYEKAEAFFRNIFALRRRGPERRQNKSDPFAFEIAYWRDEGTVTFRYAAPSERARRNVQQGLGSHYPNADIEVAPEPALDIRPGDYLSVTREHLRKQGNYDYLQPINNHDLNPEQFVVHPYDGITNAMTPVNDYGIDASVLIQIVLKPAISTADSPHEDLNWHHRAGEKAKELDSEETFEIRWISVLEDMAATASPNMDDDVQYTKDEYQSAQDSKDADVVSDQEEILGYHVNVRILAVSSDPTVAVDRTTDVAQKYRNFYNSRHGQGFRRTALDEAAVWRTAQRVADREWVDRQMPMPVHVLASLASPPTNLHTDEVEYTYQRNDEGVATSLPSFDEYDETGVVDELSEHQNRRRTGGDG